jgi:hypothetical protein
VKVLGEVSWWEGRARARCLRREGVGERGRELSERVRVREGGSVVVVGVTWRRMEAEE